MTHAVTIWHNVRLMPEGAMSGMLYGYQDGDEVAPVFVFTAGDHNLVDNIPELAFRLFNAPIEYLTPDDAAIANRYRANRLRSLSVGDLVQVDGEFFACDRFGFKKLSDPDITVADNRFDNWKEES